MNYPNTLYISEARERIKYLKKERNGTKYRVFSVLTLLMAFGICSAFLFKYGSKNQNPVSQTEMNANYISSDIEDLTTEKVQWLLTEDEVAGIIVQRMDIAQADTITSLDEYHHLQELLAWEYTEESSDHHISYIGASAQHP